MKRLRFPGYNGNAVVTIPGDSQLLYMRVIPGRDIETGLLGTWLQIGESAPHLLVCPLELRAADFGQCCEKNQCNRFPGEVQIMIIVGQEAAPRAVEDRDEFGTGAPPQDVFIIYEGG